MSSESGPVDEQDRSMRAELERRRQEARARQSSVPDDERERQRKLHWMRCPKCGSELSEVQFRLVRIDKCFSCGGVYLDDGELEQLTGQPGWFESMLRFFRG